MVRQYQIRQLTKNNKTGEAFGITIPAIVAHEFSGISFTLQTGTPNIEYRNEIVEKIYNAFRQLSAELPSSQYIVIKKYSSQLRSDILEIQNPMQSSIILSSGCKI